MERRNLLPTGSIGENFGQAVSFYEVLFLAIVSPPNKITFNLSDLTPPGSPIHFPAVAAGSCLFKIASHKLTSHLLAREIIVE